MSKTSGHSRKATRRALRSVEKARTSYSKTERRVAAARKRLTRVEAKLARRASRLAEAEDHLLLASHKADLLTLDLEVASSPEEAAAKLAAAPEVQSSAERELYAGAGAPDAETEILIPLDASSPNGLSPDGLSANGVEAPHHAVDSGDAPRPRSRRRKDAASDHSAGSDGAGS